MDNSVTFEITKKEMDTRVKKYFLRATAVAWFFLFVFLSLTIYHVLYCLIMGSPDWSLVVIWALISFLIVIALVISRLRLRKQDKNRGNVIYKFTYENRVFILENDGAPKVEYPISVIKKIVIKKDYFMFYLPHQIVFLAYKPQVRDLLSRVYNDCKYTLF